MKKTLALLLCLAMLFTALSVNVFAAATPSVTVVTHEATASGETEFAINLAGFDSLKGFDLVVTADEGVEFKSAAAKGVTLEAGKNYVISEDKHELHIVELSKDVAGDIITVTADVVAADAHTIKVTACDLAKSGTELYATTEYTITNGEVAPYVAPKTEEKNEYVAPEAGYFIPYGSVYTGTPDAPAYVEKNEDGTFAITGATNVTTFKIPEGGFGTFGISDSTVAAKPAKQFGNVATNYNAAKNYGSLVIVGEWEAFKSYYLSNKAYSDATLIEKIYAAYNIAIEDNDYVVFEAGDARIKVYNVAQKNYMWKSATALEYAVRVFGLEDGAEYAVVAYNADDAGVEFAKEIKAVKYTA